MTSGLREFLRTAARRLAVGLGLAAAFCLGGCVDLENTMLFESDGGVTLVSRLVFDKEMEDLTSYVEFLARLSNNRDAVVLTSGVCKAISSSAIRLPPGVQLASRQFKANDHLVCEVRMRTHELPPELRNAAGHEFFTIEDDAAARQKTVRLDFDKLPDPSPDIMRQALEQMRKSPDFSANISNGDLLTLVEKTKKAAIALTQMTLRDRYIELAVAGGRVVDTDGEIAADGRSARIRMTYAELVAALLDPQARKGHKFFVTVAY
jgi:hypothetical protein